MNTKITDPGYVYKPWSEERRKKASEASRARLGIPPGHKRLYGVNVEEWKYEHIAPLMWIAKQNGYDMESIRWAIGLLVMMLGKPPE